MMQIDWLRVFTPSGWAQKTSTDWVWDDRLSNLLDREATVTRNSKWVCELNQATIWCANWPYSYGMLIDKATFEELSGVPSLSTRKRLRDYLGRDA
jgi:hypothetical protein